MRHLLRAVKPYTLVLVLIWLVTACGSSTPSPKTLVTTSPSTFPTLAPQEATDDISVGGDLTALMSQVMGDVTVVETSDTGERTTRLARPMQVLVADTTIRVPDGAQAGLICSSERWIDLTGPSDWQLTELGCKDGPELPTGTYESMAPKAGRILSLDGFTVIESQTKEKENDYGRIPVILSPRNTSILELTPELHWVEVNDAIEYVLSLSGKKGFETITVDASQIACVDHPLAAPNRICSLPWPVSEWPLEPGQTYFLTIAARTGIAADLRSSEKSMLSALAGDAAGEVDEAVAEVEGLIPDAFTQDLRLASLYMKRGLYGDAIDVYKQALEVHSAPVVYVELGDAYSQVALYRWAFDAYQKALDLLSELEDDPAVRAAAELGIGRVYYNYADNFPEAAKHFASAVQLYEEAGIDEWSREAQKALEEAQKRSP